jgi:hypothetical protein
MLLASHDRSVRKKMCVYTTRGRRVSMQTAIGARVDTLTTSYVNTVECAQGFDCYSRW